MSVGISAVSRPRHWLVNLWPLLLFLVFLAGGGYVAWLYWPELLFKTVVWQKSMHQQMAQLLQQVKVNPHQTGLALMVFSLIYGVLHAMGPGHGKVVIVTYLATHPAQLKSSLKLTFAASVLQGGVAILLVTVLLGILRLSSRYLHQSSFWLEKGSFLLVIALGILLCLRAIKRLYLQIKRLKPQKMNIQQIQPLSADHVHSDNCGCGHRHMPSTQELQAGDDWRTRLAIILAMGMRPCSGAIMVLLFSKVLGVYWWGILSAIAMAIGTSLTISLLALFVHYARRLAVRLSRDRAPAAWGAIAWGTLALTGGIILLFAGILLYFSSQPDFIGGIRPFGR
ncbi:MULTISPECIES: nickel/cobalt transporter [Yersinia]|uniref:nickel/cobalt transporter n=1 Tax=Yersinia TaxID=629 RepID=UPI0005E4236F|nr:MULTISPECIES: nickel/cobalt transporter [Yersinia]OVZ97441.1 nickel transporter [Yersinia frederiksenii]RXA96115.1 nickel/cobalt transporter [Yersinia sp. 2105 StPb PI]CNI87031.1 Ni2+-Co2+ transporter (NiCoT) family protein [Yersinia frederiksenii]CNI87687.1 Ni2+-Co2+ transporter (NiCoT) family protein [Yersinia frederiksenii]CNK44382.1 Ni2+-Co2+ transporter (NiCoT) family protein [Yersinia frederiksenii]